MNQINRFQDPKLQQEIQNIYRNIIPVPVGSIILFAIKVNYLIATNANLPAGYLLCNGASYTITDYPELYKQIGQVFGSGNVLTFKVPNLQPPIDAITLAASTNVVYGIKY